MQRCTAIAAATFVTVWGCTTLTISFLLDSNSHPSENPSPFHGVGSSVGRLARLNCEASNEASEMVYWKDFPADARFESPLRDKDSTTKYPTFELDEGRFNNIRMSMETVVTMAVAMGRTLVMVCAPSSIFACLLLPKQPWNSHWRSNSASRTRYVLGKR
jgi:hypothetical protein